MVGVSLKDATIPHEVFSHYCGAKVLLRPASPGTGIIAGKTVRAVLESAGVKDVLTKSLGSKNAANVVKATLEALLSLRLREDIYKGRGWKSRKWNRRKLRNRTAAAPPAPPHELDFLCDYTISNPVPGPSTAASGWARVNPAATAKPADAAAKARPPARAAPFASVLKAARCP